MAAMMQRRKLLILENDRALRRELEAVFSDLDVTAAEASEQTLALVRRTEPDVVLFDLGTARESALAVQSLELLRQILNISPDTKIIAMTEHDARQPSRTMIISSQGSKMTAPTPAPENAMLIARPRRRTNQFGRKRECAV